MAYTYDIRAMLRKFGVVTVMDVEAYETVLHKTATTNYEIGEWDAKSTFNTISGGTATPKAPVFTLDTLKIANINQEGPTKEIKGGQNADTLLKYGKTVTMEMQDALGKYDVLERMYGVNYSTNHQIASFTDRFPKEYTLVGTTFVIDQATGAKQPIKIVIPRFLGDGIFNLVQDAEGDATVFDLNGAVNKFEGGGFGTKRYQTLGFTCEEAGHAQAQTTEGDIPDSITTGFEGVIHGPGADNEFYFMCTNDVYTQVKSLGYREAAVDTDGPAE